MFWILLFLFFFFFNDTATTEIYTLSLHDALPIFGDNGSGMHCHQSIWDGDEPLFYDRSEEHTSELQSHVNLVCRLLLEKKKKKNTDLNISDKKKNHKKEHN